MAKAKKLAALIALSLFGAALMLFIIVADEQSILASGSLGPARMTLSELIEKGPGTNKHIELTNFNFGKSFVYDTKLVQFRDVYLPIFPNNQPQDAKNLKVLVWIRNDRTSNEPLIETREQVEQFIASFDNHPKTVKGVLRKPFSDVGKLTLELYPGIDTNSLLLLWARNFPSQDSVNNLWMACAACVVVGIAAGVYSTRK
ncbi:MAG: hypothetical protein C5B53_04840 [Candidatus Melainabacteria bacterium]|nr:MAG: hypothetical protein C5B53_04840 [Candidatus Melainabacteria bacterium]